MSEVVIINIHGGFPSSMVDKSLHELNGFSRLAAMSEVNDRVYPSNACAGPTLHDTFMDAPMGTMTDSVWHPWAFSRRASRTLFHVFKQANFKTHLFGAFGLDARLDPHTHMHFHPGNLHAALQVYGIDECDVQDAAFTCQLGFAHDKDVIRRVVDHLRKTPAENRLTVVNLLGCQDAHKCAFHDVDPEKTVIPVMSFDNVQNAYDERCFATSVVDDDVRKIGSHAHEIDALRRSALLKDWIRGCSSKCEREELVRVVSGLHHFCWKCLQEIDNGLREILETLDKNKRLDDAVIYLYSDHPISLYEHGELCEAPWEACLRSFVIRKSRQTSHPTRTSAPFSTARLPVMMLNDAGIFADWHIAPKPSACCVTLGLACSWLVRAKMDPEIDIRQLRTFFVRAIVFFNSRPYAFTFWFGIADLLGSDTLALREEWPNPVLHGSLSEFATRKALQVYEHTTDPYETNNLASTIPWLIGDSATSIKKIIDDELMALNLQNIQLKIPETILSLSIDDVSFCSVQLHNRIRERVRAMSSTPLTLSKVSMCHAETQTNEVTLRDALSNTYGPNICHMLQAQVPVQPIGMPLTIFAPHDDIDTEEWPVWVPLPIRGAYNRDSMLKVAKNGMSVTDAISGRTHVPTGFDSENVFFQSCRVLLKTAVNIFHSGGLVVGYRVFRDEKEATLRRREDTTPSNSSPINITYDPTPHTPHTEVKSAYGMSKAASIRAKSVARRSEERISDREQIIPITSSTASTLEIEKSSQSPRSSTMYRGKNLVMTPTPTSSTSQNFVETSLFGKESVKRSYSANRKSVRGMEKAHINKR
tara:strand:+ start:517 stop:2967 length:2451 start_codon:yes stop_codon:yes gene_type:complete